MNDKCCGISKHIHLEEDADVLLDNEAGEDPAWGRRRMITFDSSDVLSDQVLSLDTVVDGRDRGTCRQRSCS